MSLVQNLKISNTTIANFKSLGAAFGAATSKYWWLALCGAASGFFLQQFEQTFNNIFLNMYFGSLGLLVIALVLIQCKHSHEFITKNDQPYPTLGKFLKFALFSIILAVVAVGVGALGTVGAMVGMFAGNGDGVSIWVLLIIGAYLIALLLFSRWFLVMPAIAVDNDQTGFKRSWQLTTGSSWKLVAIFFIAFLAVGLITTIPNALAEYLLSTDLVGRLVGGALSYWTAAVSTIFYAEVTSRLFVYFHKPDLFADYL